MTFIQIGSRPYPRLFDPFGVFPYEANALKGQYNLTQGLAPTMNTAPNKKRPCRGANNCWHGQWVMCPFQGRVWWLGSIQIGVNPYPMLLAPVGGINPTHTVHPIGRYTIGIFCATHPGTTLSYGALPDL